MSNPLLYQTLVLPIDGTAALPSIQVGGAPGNSSGIGVYGDYSGINFSVGGVKIAGISASGISGAGSVDSIRVFTSAAGAGGAVSEAMTLTGILSTDTILSVTQKTPGANGLAMVGYSTLATNALTVIWHADPGAGAVVIVAVKR